MAAAALGHRPQPRPQAGRLRRLEKARSAVLATTYVARTWDSDVVGPDPPESAPVVDGRHRACFVVPALPISSQQLLGCFLVPPAQPREGRGRLRGLEPVLGLLNDGEVAFEWT